MVLDGAGKDGSRGMRALWQAGEAYAGDLKKSFGRAPDGYIGNHAARPDEDFEEIYWKYDLRMEPDWVGQPHKITRAIGFWSGDWSQFMVAHVWEDSALGLGQDPVRCVDPETSEPRCFGYNDFANMDWLGHEDADVQIYDPSMVGPWVCIEHQVRLNTPGASDGLFRTWVDGSLEIDTGGLNWRAAYTDYGINSIFFENYWNGGSPAEQERYWDNIVISTERIGCGAPCEGHPSLSVAKVDPSTQLGWTPVSCASAYDVVEGSLLLLRDSAGDFSVSTLECIADDEPATSLLHSGDAPAGAGLWFLVRVADPEGTYDAAGGGQLESRDDEIAASPAACP